MAEVATSATSEQLLVVVDPVARRSDGESVRIAKDVLGAGAGIKLCLPDGPEEFARALARRGSRRPVVVGDDRALIRAVALLHRHRELAGCALSVVPVGGALSLADDDAPVRAAGDDFASNLGADTGVVHRLLAQRAAIVNLVTEAAKNAEKVLLQREACMVGPDGDAHVVKL